MTTSDRAVSATAWIPQAISVSYRSQRRMARRPKGLRYQVRSRSARFGRKVLMSINPLQQGTAAPRSTNAVVGSLDGSEVNFGHPEVIFMSGKGTTDYPRKVAQCLQTPSGREPAHWPILLERDPHLHRTRLPIGPRIVWDQRQFDGLRLSCCRLAQQLVQGPPGERLIVSGPSVLQELYPA
jgi:hypothetical protein